MSTRLLIDGYNLLFASDVFASPAGPLTLQRTRDALLQFVANSLDQKLLGRTVIVFDATQAPSGLPHELAFAGMRVLFSRNGQEADDLLEDLIAAERAPRELLVVSSDHRVQRAARQRGAKYADSDQWLRELRSREQVTLPANASEEPMQNSAELQRWLAEFGDVDSRRLAPTDLPPLPATSAPAAVDSSPKKDKKEGKRPQPRAGAEEKPSLAHWNPFPPGYGEDLLRGDQSKGED